jgi:exopolyphosphatase / guanosine-5'-triphosphate,3'-diphosphate pyrophosphatase
MTRVAAIDCGTNSLRLLVADVAPARGGASGQLTDVVRLMEIVRLGQGVDRTGRLAADALDRTFGVLRWYADLITESGATATRLIATSATRDAANAHEFTTGVRELLGIEPEVVSGEEEAALSFAGATAELADTGPPGPYLVVDIGGGSTEFVLGDRVRGDGVRGAPAAGAPVGAKGNGVAASISVDIGCVRLTERHLHSDPPTPGEIAAATSDVTDALDAVARKLPDGGAATLVGLAGSVTTVAGIALGISAYDALVTHHARIPASQVHAVTCALLEQSHAQRAAVGVMHPGRVDVIGAGALILDRVMARFGFREVVVSEHDILDGIAWSLAAQDPPLLAREGAPPDLPLLARGVEAGGRPDPPLGSHG